MTKWNHCTCGRFSKSRGLSASVSFLSSPPPSFTRSILRCNSLLPNRTETLATQATLPEETMTSLNVQESLIGKLPIHWTNLMSTPYLHTDSYILATVLHTNSFIIRCSFFFPSIGRQPTTWPANNCLQIMVCSCVVPSKRVLLQIIVCSCVIGTTFSREKWLIASLSCQVVIKIWKQS